MARLHKFRLVLRKGVIHGERPAGYRNLKQGDREIVAQLIKKWNLKEDEPCHVLADFDANKGSGWFNFVKLDPDPSMGY